MHSVEVSKTVRNNFDEANLSGNRSYGGVLYPEDDAELIGDIDSKCEEWSMLPKENSEQMQVHLNPYFNPGLTDSQLGLCEC